MTSLPEQALARLGAELRARRQRSLIWLQGTPAQTRNALPQLLARLGLPVEQGCLLSEQPCDGLPSRPLRTGGQLLGQTLAWVAYDSFSGFNPNTFGQVAGCVGAGGVLILLSPPAAEWCAYPDPEYRQLCVEPWQPEQLQPRFLHRLIARLGRERSALHLLQLEAGWQLRAPDWPAPVHRCEATPQPPWLSQDQQQRVAEIVQSWNRRPQPLVLIADRGRGKTATLGLALLAWAAEAPSRPRRVLLTAPALSVLDALFERVQAGCAELQRDGQCWRAGNLALHWLTPDELLQQQPPADLLLVDEAAAIATPVLARLSQLYRRILFSTTQHGYEGNGRGFTLRFLDELDRLVGGHRLLRLETPVRWAPGDPLEALVNDLLLLDAEPTAPLLNEPASRGGTPPPVPVRIERLARDRLLADEPLLRALYGVLILAHYRTTPGDLRVLLDSPNLQLWCLWQAPAGAPERLVGCALVAEEGRLSEALAEGVWQGVRRPTGHLLPQALIAHEGWQELAPLRAWRILRIAVHPQVQQQGLGAQLLDAIDAQAQQEQIDYMGASFAATAGLLAFWRQQGFAPVRVGDQHDPVSASHAVVVVRPLSVAAQTWFQQARPLYARRLRYRISGALERLPVALLPELWHGAQACGAPLSAAQHMTLQGFAQFNRSLESCLLELDQLLQLTLPHWPAVGIDEADAELLINRIWRQWPAEHVPRPPGRKAQLARLRALTLQLLALMPAP